MKEYAIRDGVRTLAFQGILLASSTSKTPGRPRWIEFDLYRTEGGRYMVSRTGYSLFFHFEGCSVVTRNHLAPVDMIELSPQGVLCADCKSNGVFDPETGIFPETPRYKSWECRDAFAVISSLKQEDESGVLYLTKVAERLLTDASKLDQDIEDAFLYDYID